MFVENITENPAYYFSWIFAAGFSICCHEFAHAWTAVYYGDETPRAHLTLNPLVQMGKQSLVMLFLIGIAWGMVPVNPSAVPENRKRAMISFAGPLMNLILCALFAVAASITIRAALSEPVIQFFFIASYVNGALFVLNMLPVPTLDGYSVLSAFSPKLEEIRRKYAPRIFLGFAALIFLTPAGGYIFSAGSFMSTTCIQLSLRLIGLV
ncbi:MAG: site-2 protease family protein [Kiritimatiellales bacterium]|nr:site-2 protease family protein [Kiritimatiellales bacterium]MCF7864001.1 site-2 protease family protein [Kiritimatiellales bacterium]